MSSSAMCPRVLLEPGIPTDSPYRLLWAGIAPLAQSADHFAGEPERDDGPAHSPLFEPDARHFSRRVDLWAAHIWQATRWASLHNLTETLGHLLLGHWLQQQVSWHQRHQGQPGQEIQQEIHAVMKLRCPQDGPGNAAVLDEVFAGQLGFATGPGDPINAHNRNEDQVGDIRLSCLHQAARAFSIDHRVSY